MTTDEMFDRAIERYAYPCFRAYTEWAKMPKMWVVRDGDRWGFRVYNGFGAVIYRSEFEYASREEAKQAAHDSRPNWYRQETK